MGTLDIDDRIGILECELFNLRRHREAFDSIEIQTKPPKGTFRSNMPKRDTPPHMSDALGPTTSSAATAPNPTTSTSGPTAAKKGKGHADPTPATHTLLEPATPQASRIRPMSQPALLPPQPTPQP
ncbi:hypothetical protein DXG03_001592, partial [Asterophora parasitica]